MTNDKALKLALEALTNELACDRTNDADDDAAAEQMYDAITAIKKALAQLKPEPEQPERQLMTVEGSLRFRLDSEKQKSADLLDEVRELKGIVAKLRATQRQPLTDEQDRALCEAYCNDASDEYFKARQALDFLELRRIFYAGYRKAWINYKAAHGIKEAA